MKDKLINIIVNYINEIWKTYAPNIKKEELINDGELFYRNGNDGTDFDWKINKHLCPFMTFFKNGWGFIMITAFYDGTIEGCIFDKNEPLAESIKAKPIKVDKELVKELYKKLRDIENSTLLFNKSLKEFGFEY